MTAGIKAQLSAAVTANKPACGASTVSLGEAISAANAKVSAHRGQWALTFKRQCQTWQLETREF